MPSGAVHDWLSEALGYDSMVDRVIDLPYAWLGYRHRVLFHQPLEAAVIGAILDGDRGALGGLVHVEVDRLLSEDRELKNLMEVLAVLRRTRPKPGEITITFE